MRRYIGRFAPSPSGDLHLGSLVAALGSWLDARCHGGQWLLRIEDIDPQRVVIGAAERIQEQLLAHGLHWDGAVTRQSEQLERYEAALQALDVYPCYCSRKSLRQYGAVYPGFCRPDWGREGREYKDGQGGAVRLRLGAKRITFTDRRCGEQQQDLDTEVGDFIVRRRDGWPAYQLAVVVDDAAQGVTDVVRGEDLLDNTPRQIYLQQQLQLPTPRYLHLPLACHRAGGPKLSKQTGAPALDTQRANSNLRLAFQLLSGISITEIPPCSNVADFLQWGVTHYPFLSR